ncbi:hypothetical protein CCHOA_04970 [Corynebacterium choanae]|uniref:Uncharacterized protein n=1 Tax=Corynebacterium choanae TaxID=1862358 RepID=A0A3G6JAA6_9CORY|nr:hypothetical protein CCHOA_04970 [Corynebacterium choanae]
MLIGREEPTCFAVIVGQEKRADAHRCFEPDSPLAVCTVSMPAEAVARCPVDPQVLKPIGSETPGR